MSDPDWVLPIEDPQSEKSHRWGYGQFDLGKPSLVVIAVAPTGETLILEYVGCDITMMIEEHGLAAEELDLGHEEPGIWLWEGTYHWYPGSYEYPDDGDGMLKGIYRRPTLEELQALAEGKRLWVAKDWDAPEAERRALERKLDNAKGESR